MDRNILKTIVLDQHQVIKNADIVKKDYILEDNVCYVLVGLRRAGKSTLLYDKVIKLINSGVLWEQIIYINFEDERLSEFNINDFQDILILKNEITSKKAYFFFDEIQNIDGWEKFARRLADSGETVCITGSNSKMLSSEMSARLGGRYITKYIMPYSFKEFIRANSIDIDESSKSKGEISNKLNEYIKFGGLPGVLSFNDKREYISSVYSKLLLNDVLLHNSIRNENFMKILVKKLAETVNDEMSFTKINNVLKTIGFKSSKDTIIDYIGYLKDANLIFDIKNFYAAFIDKESTPKYYFTDNGILNLFLIDKLGVLLENLVAVELKRQGRDFYYLKSIKTGIDIDFYILDTNTAIQVSYSVSDYNTFKRETTELLKFAKTNSECRLYIITLNEDRVIEENGKVINIVPFEKAFLR